MPEDLLVRAAPPREAKVAKTRDREADLMARMEKSMLKAAVKEEGERARLPLLPDSNNQKGWGLSAKLGKHSAIWGKLGTALQAYTLNPCTKFPPNPTSRKVNT